MLSYNLDLASQRPRAEWRQFLADRPPPAPRLQLASRRVCWTPPTGDKPWLPDLREAAARGSWARRGRRAMRGSQGRLGAALPIERGFESAVMMPNLGHPIQLPLRIGISPQLIFPEA